LGDVDPAARRKQVGAAARRTLDELETILRQGTILVTTPKGLRKQASDAADELIQAKVARKLRSTPLKELRNVVAKGVRFGKLEDTGYRTVADVRSAPVAELVAVSGVGESSARAIFKAAMQVADQFRRDAAIQFDLERRPAQETKLLSRLLKLHVAEQSARQLRPEIERLRRKATPLLSEAGRATSKVLMFLSRKSSRAAALTALQDIEALLKSPVSARCNARSRKPQRLCPQLVPGQTTSGGPTSIRPPISIHSSRHYPVPARPTTLKPPTDTPPTIWLGLCRQFRWTPVV
jgi:hypothetical protein